MKYRLKPQVVEADYYQPGMGLESGITTKQVSFLSAREKEAAKTWYDSSILADKSSRIKLPYILNAHSRWLKNGQKQTVRFMNIIHADHVIITEATGKRWLIKEADFEKLYEKENTDRCSHCGKSIGQQKALAESLKGATA